MSNDAPSDTERLTIKDPQNSSRSLMRLTGANGRGVIQFLDPQNGSVTLQLNETDIRNLLNSVASFPSIVSQLRIQIGQFETLVNEMRGNVAELQTFITNNFADSGSRLTLKKRTIPLEGFQQRDGDGIAFYDDNSNGRFVVRNYGGDSTILSKNDNGTGLLRVNKRRDTEE